MRENDSLLGLGLIVLVDIHLYVNLIQDQILLLLLPVLHLKISCRTCDIVD